MRCFISGVAGFIGSNFCDYLLSEGHEVVGYDNYSTGRLQNLQNAFSYGSKFKMHQADVLNINYLSLAMAECDIVFHFQANADVRDGVRNTRRDLEQNTICTYNILEAMRIMNIKRIVFSSTGSVYGEKQTIIPENTAFPIQTSLYGASKLACEGLIQAYSEAFDIQSYIYRFVGIQGQRYSHGFVYDIYNKLKINETELSVYGNGYARKSYLHIDDCISGVMTGLMKSDNKINIFNLGTDEEISVYEGVNIILDYLHLSPKVTYGKTTAGWVGDNTKILLDCNKIRSFGWKPEYTIKESIIKTIQYLENNL